jgi:hypothetical protein
MLSHPEDFMPGWVRVFQEGMQTAVTESWTDCLRQDDGYFLLFVHVFFPDMANELIMNKNT